MNKCFINQCGYNDTRECNYCIRYNNVTKCSIYVENNSIQLKPITNETFNHEFLYEKKINEEISEFKIANTSYNISKKYDFFNGESEEFWKDNIVEEFYDVIQSMLQLMIFKGITLEEIIQGQEKHFEKLEKRGWKFDE